MEEVEEETIGIINGMSGNYYRITGQYEITVGQYELLVSIELPVGMELPVLPVGQYELPVGMELPVILVVWTYRLDWLFIENSRMLGNIYGITGLIVGY